MKMLKYQYISISICIYMKKGKVRTLFCFLQDLEEMGKNELQVGGIIPEWRQSLVCLETERGRLKGWDRNNDICT